MSSEDECLKSGAILCACGTAECVGVCLSMRYCCGVSLNTATPFGLVATFATCIGAFVIGCIQSEIADRKKEREQNALLQNAAPVVDANVEVELAEINPVNNPRPNVSRPPGGPSLFSQSGSRENSQSRSLHSAITPGDELELSQNLLADDALVSDVVPPPVYGS